MKIAIIDSGIEKRFLNDKCEAISVKGTEWTDDLGHGTSVYTIIRRICGDKDYVLNVKMLDGNGKATMDSVIDALILCMERGIDVYNLSFSIVKDTSLYQFKRLTDIINKIIRSGASVFCSATNKNNGDWSLPASLFGVYGVTGALFHKETHYIYDDTRKIQILGNASPAFIRNNNGGLSLFRGNSKATSIMTGRAIEWRHNQKNVDDELRNNSLKTRWDDATIREINEQAYAKHGTVKTDEKCEYLELFQEYKQYRKIEGDIFSKFIMINGKQMINRLFLDAICFVEKTLHIKFKEESMSIFDLADENSAAHAMLYQWEKYE